MARPSVGIIGIGGYGARHLDSVRACENEGLCRLKAVVIREIEMEALAAREAELRRAGVAVYRSYPELLEREKGRLDLVTVPAGIDQHAPQSLAALAAGYSVLCEKPAAGTLAEALDMKKARDAAGKILAIGFQYVSAPSIQRLKKLTLEKRYGALVSAKGWAAWPRTSAYYGRNYWAGRLRVNGKFIHDSPVQNAVSHFFNNMLYLAGPSADQSALPASVYGENYRAGPIESADTQFIRAVTADGVELSFFATHAVNTLVNPVLEFSYEYGRAVWEQNGRTRVYAGGRGEPAEQFDDGGVELRDEMFRNVLGTLGRDDGRPRAGIDNSWQHAACVGLSFESCPIVAIPDKYVSTVEVEEDPAAGGGAKARQTVIAGIDEIMAEMGRAGRSFSEVGAPWSAKGKPAAFNAPGLP